MGYRRVARNKNLKKSLRVNGAWTTHPPALFEDKIADSGLSVDEIAERILFWSDRSLELSLDHAILENLVTQIENNIHWQQRKSYSDAHICAYVLTAQLGEARQLAQFCALHGQPVDYVVGDKNFGAMALDWLDARIPRRDPWKRATDAVRRFFMRPGDPLKR
ncbi:hypothetical protein RUR49_22115 [Pseudoxanthobacter sp. M-2]|uniref:hypothetical protein n=1 Tax=Pseudoxanthobacter sp. M-2 TaxID=3078754 RepID=UPI0038FCD95C